MRAALLGGPESEPSGVMDALVPTGGFRALLDASSDGFYSTDTGGRCCYINPAMLRLLGYDAHELVGQRIHDIVHHTRPDGMPFPYEECRLTGCLTSSVSSLDEQCVYWRSDGTALPVELEVRPVLLAGEVVGAVVKAVDLSRSPHFGAELLRLMAAGVDAFAALDDQGVVVAWNPAAQQLLGWRTKEVMGRPLVDVLLPQATVTEGRRVLLDRELLSCGVGSTHPPVVVRAVRRDGTSTDVQLKVSRIPWGGCSRLHLVLKDVDRVREARAALARSDTMYRLLASTSTDIIARTSESGEILSLSPSVETVLGWAPAELIGRGAETLLHPDDLAVGNRPTRSPGLTTCRALHRDGSWVWLESTTTFVGDEDSAVREVLVCSRDITERLAQQAADEHLSRLESLGRLAAGLAHEINTPIQYIGDNAQFLAGVVADLMTLALTYRQVLDSTTEGERCRRIEEARATEEAIELDYLQREIPGAVTQTLAGIDRVGNIVRAMKTFSHPGHADHVPAELNDALDATATVARHQVTEVADLVMDLGVLPPVVCNVASLNQVFLNLIVNAADAVEETGTRGRIVVTSSTDGDDVVVSVSDTGGGVPEAIREKIFEPFFTTKRIGRGTGQGLALARSVVHQGHGGVLTVETNPDGGSTFTVRLPVSGVSTTS